jgi:hypothetical protein
MRKISRLAVALTVCLFALTACPATTPGQDPVTVNAQRVYSNSRDTLDLLFNLELSDRALIESKLPGTHAVVDGIKTQAKVALPEFLKAIDTYSVNHDKETLDKWQAVAQQLLESAKVILANLGKQNIAGLTERMVGRVLGGVA